MHLVERLARVGEVGDLGEDERLLVERDLDRRLDVRDGGRVAQHGDDALDREHLLDHLGFGLGNGFGFAFGFGFGFGFGSGFGFGFGFGLAQS